jgi:hypothetical protein
LARTGPREILNDLDMLPTGDEWHKNPWRDKHPLTPENALFGPFEEGPGLVLRNKGEQRPRLGPGGQTAEQLLASILDQLKKGPANGNPIELEPADWD